MVYKVIIGREKFGRRDIKVYVHDLPQRTSLECRNRIDVFCLDADTFAMVKAYLEENHILLQTSNAAALSTKYTSAANTLYIEQNTPKAKIRKTAHAEKTAVMIKNKADRAVL